MKDNIPSELIQNRKLILEIRNTSNLNILDNKGKILEELTKLNIFTTKEWATSDTGVKISDSEVSNEERETIYFDLHRLSFITSRITTIDQYFNNVKKIFEIYKKYSENSDINRIGCRIIGTYNTKSNSFKDIVDKFQKEFPKSIFIDEFPLTDLKLTIKYNSGIYEIGPVDINDDFTLGHFKHKEQINKIGFGIDTDNFIIKSDKSLKNISKIQDVITATLAVEKALVDKINEF